MERIFGTEEYVRSGIRLGIKSSRKQERKIKNIAVMFVKIGTEEWGEGELSRQK